MLKKIAIFAAPSFISLYFTQVQHHPMVQEHGFFKGVYLQYAGLFVKMGIQSEIAPLLFAGAIVALIHVLHVSSANNKKTTQPLNYARSLQSLEATKQDRGLMSKSPKQERMRLKTEAEMVVNFQKQSMESKEMAIEKHVAQ